jgi:hypothetical protein
MPEASRTIHIERPVGQVFAFFTDPTNDKKWRSHVVEIAARGPLEVGVAIHQKIAGPGGRAVRADIEVTGYDSPRRYAFKVTTGPVRPMGEFRFAPSGTGTDVNFRLQAQLSGLKKLILSRPVQKSMDGEVAGLDKAKAFLEDG